MKRKPNRGWFRKGRDPRRHALTPAERKKGGVNCAKKYTVVGRWPLDWHEACERGEVPTQLDTGSR